MVLDLKLPANGYDAELWYFFMGCQAVAYYPTWTPYHRLFDAAGKATVTVFRGSHETQPDMIAAVYERHVIVCIQGTQSWAQLRPQITRLGQVTRLPFPGQVSQLYADWSQELFDKLVPFLDELATTRTITVVGHSLGAALAHLVGGLVATRYTGRIDNIVAFASPRVGNLAFSTGYAWRIWRIDNDDDWIPDWPPGAVFIPVVGPALERFGAWAHVPRQWTLFAGGNIANARIGTLSHAGRVEVPQTFSTPELLPRFTFTRLLQQAADWPVSAITGRSSVAPALPAMDTPLAHHPWGYLQRIRQRLPLVLKSKNLPALHIVDEVLAVMGDDIGRPFRPIAPRSPSEVFFAD